MIIFGCEGERNVWRMTFARLRVRYFIRREGAEKPYQVKENGSMRSSVNRRADVWALALCKHYDQAHEKFRNDVTHIFTSSNDWENFQTAQKRRFFLLKSFQNSTLGVIISEQFFARPIFPLGAMPKF